MDETVAVRVTAQEVAYRWVRAPRGRLRHASESGAASTTWCGLYGDAWIPADSQAIPHCTRCVAAMRADGVLTVALPDVDALLAMAESRPAAIDVTARYGAELRDALRMLRALRDAIGDDPTAP